MALEIVNEFYSQWKINTDWISNNLNSLSDEDLKLSFAEGKNHGVWILGHLIESEDELSEFLGKGSMMYPGYLELFGQGSKLLPVSEYPEISLLRKQWIEVRNKNDTIIKEMKDVEWNEPHCGKGQGQDFFKTKGRCIYIWNLHQAFHNGQLTILLSFSGKAKI